jgi:hypothetical protein
MKEAGVPSANDPEANRRSSRPQRLEGDQRPSLQGY